MIGIADELKAMTTDKILGESNEIRYSSGDTSSNGNTVADQITNILKSKRYLTEELYSTLSDANQLELGVEYNIFEI